MLAQRHKSYPTVLPTANRFLQYKWDGHNYNFHRGRVSTIKSTVDTRQPPPQPHMSRTGKDGSRQRRLATERQREIERENLHLLKKMMKINERGGRVDNRNENKYSKSLNSWKRQQEMDRIERENVSVLKRLALREPEYDRQIQESQWLEHDERAIAISKYPRRWWEYPKKSTKDYNRPNTGSHEYMKRQRSILSNPSKSPRPSTRA